MMAPNKKPIANEKSGMIACERKAMAVEVKITKPQK